MMRLRNMVKGLASDAVAKLLIQKWEHDEGTLKFWRASSNFVYVFERNQERYFLRFSFEQENSIEQIKSELDFMQYLNFKSYPCVSPIPSITGEFIETVQNSEGMYFAVVFSSAKGITLDENITEVQCEDWGKSLASLHSLSRTYQPGGVRRKSWQDILQKINDVLQRHPQEQEAMKELDRITIWLQSLSTSNNMYGLIHYDFQQDNIFYRDSDGSFDVIDFDDAMYHWYALDIITSLIDFYENDDPNSKVQIKSFLTGYRSIGTLDDETESHFPKVS